MNERQMREKLLFRYSGALERGDFETLAAVLAEAERDPILEAMILEMNEVYGAELPAPRPKETLPMTTVMTFDRRRPPVLRYAMALAAAAALVLVVGLLALTGRDTRLAPQPGDDNGAALLQSSTATPTPAPLILPATATPIPMVADPLLLAPERVGTSICIAAKAGMVAAVRSRPSLDARPISQIGSGTPMSVLRLTVDGAEPASPMFELVEAGALDAWMAQGIDSPLWFFGWARVDDAVIQGWVLGDQGIEVIACPLMPETIVTVVPTVPPSDFMPTIVPTSTPFPIIDPVFMTATAVINEATQAAVSADAIPITATAIINEATAQMGDIVPLVPTVVPSAAVEDEIAALSATIEALRAQIGTPAPVVLCTVYTPMALIVHSRPVGTSPLLQPYPIPARTQMAVTGLVSGVSDGITWYQVDVDFDGGSIRGGYVRADQVQEVTPCPGL